MNPEIKAKWVAALRSGQYMQIKGKLTDGKGFCCLGVLCDIHAHETGGTWETLGFTNAIEYGGEQGGLPFVVQRWAGLDSRNPNIKQPNSIYNKSLAEYNDGTSRGGQYDRPCSFTEIAQIIERYL
jgi:hypothetical protein